VIVGLRFPAAGWVKREAIFIHFLPKTVGFGLGLAEAT